jgi:hypothetical protein
MINLKAYESYRWFFTSEGKLVVGGKSDEQNELVIKNFLKPDYTVMHTSSPGSSFMIIQSKNPSKKDIEETAIFTGCFSKQWKNSVKNIEIDIFKGEQIYKLKSMKKGTFGVKGDKKTIKIKPELALVIQKGKFKAVPNTTKEKKLARIMQGTLSKEKASEILAKIIKDKFHLPVHKDEIMSAIPSDKINIKER